MSFGRLMKEYRIKRGLIQEDLATQLNKSRIMIYNYERDRNEVPDLVKNKIIEILNIPDKEIEDDNFNEIFPFKTDFEKNLEILESLGFTVLFDKNDDVYLYNNDKLVLKSSKENINNFIKYKKIDSLLEHKEFKEPVFLDFLKEYVSSLIDADFLYKDSLLAEKEYILKYKTKEINLPEEFLYSLLFMMLNILEKELKGYIESVEQKKQSNKYDRLK